MNTVIASRVDVHADIAAINCGEAIKRGTLYEIGERIYGVEPGGTAYPVAGPGTFALDRAAYRALGVYNRFGLTAEAEQILDRMATSSAARVVARNAYRMERNPP